MLITITTNTLVNQIKLSGKIPEIVENIVCREIIEKTASDSGIKLDVNELQEAADKYRVINQIANADDTWKWLDKHGLSLDDFENMIRNNLLTSKLAELLFGHKVEPYFYENQLNYASAVIYEIILDDEDLAMELYYAIKEKEISFFNVAHEYIKDIELRRRCGYRGQVKRKDLKPEISAVVFAAKPSQLLKPVITATGIHLIFVEEITQAELSNSLRQTIISSLFTDWLRQEVSQLEIIKELGS